MIKTNKIQEFFTGILSEKEKGEWDKSVLELMAHDRWMLENDYEYCTPTSPSLILLRENGFKPIGITSHYLEETFIFSTKKEAHKAYMQMEKKTSEVIGWYYSKRDWEEEYQRSKKEYYKNKHPMIYWI